MDENTWFIERKMEWTPLYFYVLKNIRHLHKIKTEYLELLRELTEAPDIPDSLFLMQVLDIHRMGDIIVGIEDGHLVCSGTIIVEPKIIRCGRPVGHIEDIVVLPGSRGKGLARKLLTELKEHGVKQGCYKLILDCHEGLEGFYSKLGFEKKGAQMAEYFATI